jgi:hypothetical protein
MRAPKKSRLDEVVAEIVDAIRNDAEPDFVEIDVRTTITILRELDRDLSARGRIPARGWRQQNNDDFAELRKQIKALEKALKQASGPALFMLFSGEEDLGADKTPSLSIQKHVQERHRMIDGLLEILHRRCDFLLEQQPGEHGSAEYRQRRIAEEAWRLLCRYQEKRPARGTADSLYGRTASLLFEAVTGEADKDLQRACKTVLEAGGARPDGIIGGIGTIFRP